MAPKNLSRNVGLVFLALFALHVGISLYITFNPWSLGKSKPVMFYDYLVSLGPFFTEERLSVYSHLVVGLHYNNQWHDVDVTEREVQAYRSNIFATRHLTTRDFLNRSASYLKRTNLDTKSTYFKNLHAFVKRSFLDTLSPDSIRFQYKNYHIDTQTETVREEEVFTIQYRPQDVE